VSKHGSLIGNIFFWTVLLAASAGAFAVGFWYTFGATVNVNTKSPVAETTAKPGAIRSPGLAAKPTATPTLAPGPLPVPSELASTLPSARPAGTPTPMAVLGAVPSPARVQPTAEPTPVPTKKEEIYRVQVGAFDSRESAQRQVDELHGVGINAVVVYDGGAYHAQLGAYRDRAAAISVADEVNNRGYSVTIRH
jgi:cell division protein FtsN